VKGGETMEQSTHPAQADPLGEDQGEDGAAAPGRYGRRALLLTAGAAGAALSATLASGSDPADAANNNPIELGQSNSASTSTVITTSAANGLNGLLRHLGRGRPGPAVQ
jgi:hypothetical protein